MKVLVLGSGVIGVTTAYYLARAGHEVTVVDRQAEPAHETSFRQCRRGVARLFLALGRPRRAGQGDQVAVDAAWPAGDLAQARSRDVDLGLLKLLRNCTSERYAVNKSRMIPIAEYSRDCLRALRAEIGIKYDERSRGTLQLFRKQTQLDGTARRYRGAQTVRRAVRGARSRRLHWRRACARRREGQVRRRAAAAAGRDRRLPHVHAGARRGGRKARRPVPLQYQHRAAGRGRRQDHRRRHQRRAVAGRRLCRGARQLVAAIAQAASAFRFRSIR